MFIGRICSYFYCLNAVKISREQEKGYDSWGHEHLSLNIGASVYALFGGSVWQRPTDLHVSLLLWLICVCHKVFLHTEDIIKIFATLCLSFFNQNPVSTLPVWLVLRRHTTATEEGTYLSIKNTKHTFFKSLRLYIYVYIICIALLLDQGCGQLKPYLPGWSMYVFGV